MRIVNGEKKEFKPFQFTIEIETEDDLRNIWHRFEINNSAFFEASGGKSLTLPQHMKDGGKSKIWDFLDEKAKESGLKQ